MISELATALAETLRYIDQEIEDRKFGGNDEDWEELLKVSNQGHFALRHYYWNLRVRKGSDIENMTSEECRQWLIINDAEAKDYWRDLPPDADFHEAVRNNVKDFGYDE